MATLELKAEIRDDKGKSKARQARRAGWIPGILYGEGADPQKLSVLEHDLELLFHEVRGEHAVVNLRIPGEAAECPALVKDVQHHPTKGSVLHIDFQRVSATRRIRVKVHVVLEGDAIGVKDYGGVMEHPLHEVEVECLPGDLPEKLTVDVSALKIGDSVHLGDLPSDDRVTILGDPTSVVAIVVPPAVVKEAAPAEEEAAEEGVAAEGAAPEGEKPEESTGKAD